MISEDACSVRKTLISAYGLEFCRASIEECLVLIEAIALSLRVGGVFGVNLQSVVKGSSIMPPCVYAATEVGRNEGLKLLAMLQVAIVEKYSVSRLQSKT